MATFGKTDKGSATFIGFGDYISGCRFELTEDGDVSKITVWLYNSSDTHKVKCAIYSDDEGVPDVFKGETEEKSIGIVNDWVDFSFSPALSLSAGHYWLCVWRDGDFDYFYYDAGAANQYCYEAIVYNGFPNPFPTPDGYSARELSIYATYTPSVPSVGKGVTQMYLVMNR